MPTRDSLARELERIKAHWPSMPATGTALDGYADALRGYDDMELHGAVTLLLTEYDAASNPKPKHLADMCARIAKIRRGDVAAARRNDDLAYCPHCGTRELVEVPHPGWDTTRWTPLSVSVWRRWLGALWPAQSTFLQLPARLEPVCTPSCVRRSPRRTERA